MDEHPSLPVLKHEARLRLMETVTKLLIAAMVMFTLARYIVGMPLASPVLVAEVCYCLVLGLSWRLARRSSSLVLPGWLIVLGLLLTVIVASLAAGGLNAPILVALPLIPLLSALLLGRRSLPPLIVILASLLMGLCLLQQQAWIEPRPLDDPTRRFCQLWVLVTMVCLCASLGYYCDRQNDEMHQQLTLWAHTDGLTGVANRRFFDECLNQEWMRNQRMGRPLSLLLLDIDHFKQYNDAYGHVEGDRCLRTIAQAISNHCRRSGELVARYGGEEFAVILPNVDLGEAAAIADSLRLKIEALHGQGNPDLQETVTVSIGFTSAVPHGFEQQERFIVQADEALYRAKRAGRNQSVGSIAPGSRVNVQ